MKNLFRTPINGIWVLPSILVGIPVSWILNRLFSLSIIALRGQDGRSQMVRFVMLTLLFVVITALSSFIMSYIDRCLGWEKNVDHPLRRLLMGSSTMSKYAKYWFPAGALTLFAILVANQLHGSSIGIYWHYVAKSDTPDPALVFGQTRAARSDEFMVSTLWTLSQYQVNFQETNTLIGSGQKLVLSDSPIWNWEVVFEPQNLIFFLLPTEYSFSFRWWFRGLMLLLASYLFFLQLGEGKWYLAALASISTLFMPVIQWWYSTTYVEIAAYFFLLLYLFRLVVEHRSKKSFILSLILFCYFSLCFASLIYPPTLIPALICVILIIVGILLNKWTTEMASLITIPSSILRVKAVLTSKQNRLLVVGLMLALIVNAVFIIFFYADNKDTFDAIRNSSYPGARRSVGGTLPSELFLGGFFDVLLTKIMYPVPLGVNQSEGASFFPLSFFVFPVLLFAFIKSFIDKRHIDHFLNFLLLAYGILLVWGFFGLPDILNNFLLLQYSIPIRSILIIAILNQIIIYYYLEKLPIDSTRDFTLFSLLFSLAVLSLYLYWVKSLTHIPTISEWLPGWKYWAFILWTIVVLLLLPLLLIRQKLIFWLLFTTFTVVTTGSVNPLYRGLDVVLNNDLAKALREVNSFDNGEALWISYDNVIMSNYLVANGIKVLNASQLYPQNNLWSQFDDGGKNITTYNRYAHIVIAQTDSKTNTDFVLHNGDVFAVKIHPCNTKLDRLGVKYLFFLGEVKYDCLEKVKVVDVHNFDFYIYKRRFHQ